MARFHSERASGGNPASVLRPGPRPGGCPGGGGQWPGCAQGWGWGVGRGGVGGVVNSKAAVGGRLGGREQTPFPHFL